MDIYRYDEAWELQPLEAISQFSKVDVATPSTVLIDLRKPDDFLENSIPGSYNLPLQSMNSATSSPFFDPTVLEQQWKEIDGMLSYNTISAYDLSNKNVGVICYNGDTARVATSILRAKGIAASSIKGGIRALTAHLPQLQTKDRVSFHQWSKMSNESNGLVGRELLSPNARPRSEVFVEAV